MYIKVLITVQTLLHVSVFLHHL